MSLHDEESPVGRWHLDYEVQAIHPIPVRLWFVTFHGSD